MAGLSALPSPLTPMSRAFSPGWENGWPFRPEEWKIPGFRTLEALPRRGDGESPRVGDQREPTLGGSADGERTLKGFHTAPDHARAECNPFRVGAGEGCLTQGALLRRDPGLLSATPSGYRRFATAENLRSERTFLT